MRNTVVRFAAAAVLTGVFGLPAFAQSQNWKVDNEHSVARFALDVKINDSNQRVTVGAAKVSGTLRLDASDPTQSTFEFSIYPAGADAVATDPGGETAKAASMNYTLLSFQSRTAALTGDGKLRVTGVLTLVRAELTPTEGNSGPRYTAHVVSQSTREESFVFAIPGPDPGNARDQASPEISAIANIDSDDFPELVNTVLLTDWPTVAQAQDQNCERPLTTGEDYSVDLCPGSSVALPSSTRPASSFNGDYPGSDSRPEAAGNNATIALHLRLTQEGVQVSAKTGQ